MQGSYFRKIYHEDVTINHVLSNISAFLCETNLKYSHSKKNRRDQSEKEDVETCLEQFLDADIDFEWSTTHPSCGVGVSVACLNLPQGHYLLFSSLIR